MLEGVVSTIQQKCKRCYSCIRECPANAIRVEGGQAVVIAERCISCGHCVKVCSQNAKFTLNDVEFVTNGLLTRDKTVAVVAPSFAASFPDDYNKIPTALRRIGFDSVVETAFGADLISDSYVKLMEKKNGNTIISSACPAVYNYVEKYFPELLPSLAKVVSPMIAIARYLRNTTKGRINIVFIGPCIAKKSEYRDEEVKGEIDAVITFGELKEIFRKNNIKLNELESSRFDPPNANVGRSYPLPGGLLKTANISNDVLAREVIIVEGKDKVKEIINDISENKIKSKFVDILFCEGCINGPAIDSNINYYSKREKVIDYFEENHHTIDKRVWKSNIYNSRTIDFSRQFNNKCQRRPMPTEEKIAEILAKTNKYSFSDELNCGACGYKSCREYAISIAKGLAEEEMCLPYLIDKLEQAYDDLKDTQNQLHNAEKLASIGQLASGVAHEINNPLGTILLYASMLKREYEKKICSNDQTNEDLALIINEANRCKNIVSNLLNFARQGKLKISKVNIAKIIEEIIASIRRLSSVVEIQFTNNSNGKEIYADPDQIKQVLLNIINNAIESMDECSVKKVTVDSRIEKSKFVISVRDNGCGIPEENMNKLFTPFFTTKKIGKGTGLGLAISYGIIKMHKGNINISSEVGKGTTVQIELPINPDGIKETE